MVLHDELGVNTSTHARKSKFEARNSVPLHYFEKTWNIWGKKTTALMNRFSPATTGLSSSIDSLRFKRRWCKTENLNKLPAGDLPMLLPDGDSERINLESWLLDGVSGGIIRRQSVRIQLDAWPERDVTWPWRLKVFVSLCGTLLNRQISSLSKNATIHHMIGKKSNKNVWHVLSGFGLELGILCGTYFVMYGWDGKKSTT